MKAALMGMLARVKSELPFMAVIWFAECLFIAMLYRAGVVGWWPVPLLLMGNLLVLMLCDLVDQLLERVINGKE